MFFESTIIGFWNRSWLSWLPFCYISESDKNLNMLQSLILLTSKLYAYQSRVREVLDLNSLIKN